MSKRETTWFVVFMGLCIGLIIGDSILFQDRLDFAQTTSAQSAYAFTMGMLHNDQRLLMSIVVPEKHDEVYAWVSSNRRYYCRPSRVDFPTIRHEVYIKKLSQNGSSIDYGTLYICRLDRAFKGLNFQIYWLTTTQIDGKWYIKDWSYICKHPHLAGCG